MTPEEIWRRKSDEEVIAANKRLSEYTEVGQRIILAEMDRRGLSPAAALNDPERIESALPGSSAHPDTSKKPVAGLKRRSVLLMIVFTLITLGIYYPCWFLMRRNAINSMNANTKL